MLTLPGPAILSEASASAGKSGEEDALYAAILVSAAGAAEKTYEEDELYAALMSDAATERADRER